MKNWRFINCFYASHHVVQFHIIQVKAPVKINEEDTSVSGQN